VPIGEGDVEVWSFYEFCGHILNESVDHNIHDDDYYQTVLEQAMEETEIRGLTYDAILIDEGQDFTDAMMAFVKQLLNPKCNNLTVVLDENQNIYRRKLSWKKLGFNFAGKRTCVLKYAYRSTVELNTFVKNFLNCSENLLNDGKNGQMEMFPGYGDFHGPDPFLIQIDTLKALRGYALDCTDYNM
jgi:superfamily I DNA/RNA helicase